LSSTDFQPGAAIKINQFKPEACELFVSDQLIV
jgi:hypothetical protein